MVDYFLENVNGLSELVDTFELFILDRDCTLQKYHGKKRVPEFEETLKIIGPKSELVSDSSIDEFIRIGELYSDIMAVDKLVNIDEVKLPVLLRIKKGEMRAYTYNHNNVLRTIEDVTKQISSHSGKYPNITFQYAKPNPLIIQSIISINEKEEGKKILPMSVLMVGDRYLTDIVCGNLAQTNTALVKPYKPLSDPIDLILVRCYDHMYGEKQRKLNEKNYVLDR